MLMMPLLSSSISRQELIRITNNNEGQDALLLRSAPQNDSRGRSSGRYRHSQANVMDVEAHGDNLSESISYETEDHDDDSSTSSDTMRQQPNQRERRPETPRSRRTSDVDEEVYLNQSYYQFDPLMATILPSAATAAVNLLPPRSRPRLLPSMRMVPQGRGGGFGRLAETYMEIEDDSLELSENETTFVLIVLGALACMFAFMLFVTIMTFIYTASSAT
jgi:hypothetical protein